MTTFNAEAEIARLTSRAKLRKEEAKGSRDDGDIPAAIEALTDVVSEFESSPLSAGLAGTDEATGPQKTLAAHLADCLGMLGGNYRRLGLLDKALASFERGRVFEEDERLSVPSSYNLVNAITVPLEMGRTAREQEGALLRAVAAIDRQVKGERRSDRWAWADLAQCQLLLGRVEDARKSYARVRDLGDDMTVGSVVGVLRRLAEAVEKAEPTLAESLREGMAALES